MKKCILCAVTALAMTVAMSSDALHAFGEDSKSSGVSYDFSIYDDERSFTDEQLAVQEDFEEYINEIFADEVTQNSVTLHYDVENPEAMGIEVPEVSWGNISYTDEDNAQRAQELKDTLTELEGFDYDSLTYAQQIIIDSLTEYIEDELEVAQSSPFSSVFGPLTGIQNDLPITLAEYDFLSKDDIDDFLTLLEQSYDYVSGLCDYEKYRAEQGFALTESSIDTAIEQCNEFISAEPNCIRPIFISKLDEFSDLTDEQKQEYTERFDEGLSKSLIPAYELIITTLTEIKDMGIVPTGLCGYENGSEYYEYVVRSNTGSAKTVDELWEEISSNIDEYSEQVIELLENNILLYNQYVNYQSTYDDPDEIMQTLLSSINEDFPEAVNSDYTLNYVPESIQNDMTTAFYLVPPVDNPYRNIIYVNNSEEMQDEDLFTTMCHEGLPGHMYQFNYFYSQNQNPIRSILDFNGYSEGWAKYVEICYGYKYEGVSDKLAQIFEYDKAYSFAIYSLVDLGINYMGWDLEDTSEFLSDYVSDSSVSEEIYNMMIDDPGIYLQYYVGYLEIKELRATAEQELGDDFDVKEFHRFILEIGPLQFDIIQDRMEGWIERVKNSEATATESDTSSQQDSSTAVQSQTDSSTADSTSTSTDVKSKSAVQSEKEQSESTKQYNKTTALAIIVIAVVGAITVTVLVSKRKQKK